MTRFELLNMFNSLIEECKEVLKKRNHEYATHEDALKNIKEIGKSGIIGHLKDKVSRLETQNNIHDSCIDIANYALLLDILIDSAE